MNALNIQDNTNASDDVLAPFSMFLQYDMASGKTLDKKCNPDRRNVSYIYGYPMRCGSQRI